MSPGPLTGAFRDLRAVRPRELLARSAAALQKKSGRYHKRFPAGSVDLAGMMRGIGVAEPSLWRQHLQKRSRGRPFFVGPDEILTYRALLQKVPLDPRAEALVGGHTLVFGVPTAVDGPVSWHKDIFTNVEWPTGRPWWETPVTICRGDVRVVWELSRHRDLFVLGRAYWTTGDERFAEAARTRVESWLENNPRETGVNWGSSLEVSMRAIALTWALHLFTPSVAFSDALLWRVTQVIAASALHLTQQLAYTQACMPGNHVVGDAAGLALIALAFPEFVEAARWRERALGVLKREAVQQTTHEGVHIEFAPSYQAFVWELFYMVARLAEAADEPVPELWDAVERLGGSISLLITPDGRIPQSGDGDEAVAFDLDQPENRFRAIMALAASRFPNARLSAPGGRTEALLWLEGPDAWSTIQLKAPTPSASLHQFSCWAIGRTSSETDADWFFMRGGGTSRHTHADALHVDIVVRGKPILIDAGTGTYTGSSRWRAYFRGTRSHNTVCVADADQGIAHRAFRWVSAPNTRWLAAAFDEADRTMWFDAEHDGYSRRGVMHRRQVLWLLDWGWVVLDRVTGLAGIPYSLSWLAAAEAHSSSDGTVLLDDDSNQIALSLKTEGHLVPEIVKGQHDSDGKSDLRGWHSPRYGTIVPSWMIKVPAISGRDAAVATVLRRVGDPQSPLSVKTRRIEGAYEVQLRDDRLTRQFVFGDNGRSSELKVCEF